MTGGGGYPGRSGEPLRHPKITVIWRTNASPLRGLFFRFFRVVYYVDYAVADGEDYF